MENNLNSSVPQFKDYKLTINGNKGFVLNGLKSVIKTSPEYVSAEIGTVIVEIYGKNFTISKLSVNDGVLEVNGNLTDFKIKAGKDNTPLLKRIFK